MNRLFFAIGLVCASVLVLGYSRGWFRVGAHNADSNSNVTLSVDKEKLKADEKSAVANVKNVEQKIADKFTRSGAKTSEGTVVSVSGNDLKMTDKKGKEQSHALASDVKVTRDGKPSTVADLKAGTRIRITTGAADHHAIARIEALDKDAAFASTTHDGKTVSVSSDKLVMTNAEGAEEHTFTLAADIKVTCDGKVCKTADLKPGMKIRVTTENAESDEATRIEAIDDNRNFEKGA
jgi:hypothetical protein